MANPSWWDNHKVDWRIGRRCASEPAAELSLLFLPWKWNGSKAHLWLSLLDAAQFGNLIVAMTLPDFCNGSWLRPGACLRVSSGWSQTGHFRTLPATLVSSVLQSPRRGWHALRLSVPAKKAIERDDVAIWIRSGMMWLSAHRAGLQQAQFTLVCTQNHTQRIEVFFLYILLKQNETVQRLTACS